MKKLYKKLVFTLFLAASIGLIQAAYARIVEIEVHGMTCAFCVDSLERKFRNMSSVSKVEVSLKQKKVRLETKETQPSIAVIKQAVLEAGFTPTKITEQMNEK